MRSSCSLGLLSLACGLMGCSDTNPIPLCGDMVCNDTIACTVDTCDPDTGICLSIPDDSRCGPHERCDKSAGCIPRVCSTDADCDDGAYCNGAEVCTLGACHQGAVPCDDPFSCTVDACQETDDTCVHTPDDNLCAAGEVCDPATGDATTGCRPKGDCTDDQDCDDGLFCNGLEICEANACKAGSPVVCDDSLDCTRDICEETMRSCQHSPDHQKCGPGEICVAWQGCTAVTCADDTGCDDHFFCNGPETCEAGACTAGTALLCDDAIACTEDACDEASDGCTFRPNRDLCGAAEICDPDQGGCVPAPCLSNADCDDGLFCNGPETCEAAGCTTGLAVSCDDGVACTRDACDETLDSCGFVPDSGLCAAGEACDPIRGCVGICQGDLDCDDGLYCNGAETCVNQVCTAGSPVDCDDSVACTEDACDDAGRTCTHNPNHDLCQAGEVCDPSQGCGSVPCQGDLDCDDKLFCNGTETCAGDRCQAGTPPVCADAIDCTADSCDESNDRCANDPQDTACDNALFCDGPERCDVALGCVAGQAPDCTDGVDCTADSCDESGDLCNHVPDPAQCDNGQYCDGAEACDLNLGCQAGQAPDCADKVDCTADSCDETDDRCAHTPQDGACDNGQFCDGPERCDPAAGCLPGAPACEDGVACTADSCDEGADLCTHLPDSGLCDDGLFCNGAEFCDANLGCRPGQAPDCVDAFDCTQDDCDEGQGACTHTAQDSLCSNGLYCDGVEYCDPDLGCQPGKPVGCADTSECTEDACDESKDQCTFTPLPVGTPCAGVDINYCNSSCSSAGLCNNASPVRCSDGLECTDDVCAPADGSCSFPPWPVGTPCAGTDADRCNSSCDNQGACVEGAPPPCDDGLFCNGAEGCDPAQGCFPGTSPCDDHRSCTEDSCTESGSICTNAPNHAVCSDGLFCSGAESCDPTAPGADPASGCRPGTPIDCISSAECLTATCSESVPGCEQHPTDDDGDGHTPLLCGGDDCDDLDPTVYTGAQELCDGKDNDCDSEIDEGLGAYRDACNSDADCCSNNCENNRCAFSIGVCSALFMTCTDNSDCCSERCGPDIAGVLRCQSDALCQVVGSPCTRASDCCSFSCQAGVCATGPLCTPLAGACQVSSDCCSNTCLGGFCQEIPGNCKTLGETCGAAIGNCCSNVCTPISSTESRCGFHATCREEGDLCSEDAECCNCLCEPNGRCGSPGDCKTAYETCNGWGACCSRLCVVEPSGTGMCRFISGCLSEGELCDPTCVRDCAPCCSGLCEKKTVGGLTTNRCSSKGLNCLPDGNVCGGTGTSNCCQGGSAQCRLTRTGVTRCFGSVLPHQCLPDGSACAMSDQCCRGACLKDTNGALVCSPNCAGLGEGCSASSDCCVEPVLLKCEDCTCVESDTSCRDVGSPCDDSSQCCYGLCDDQDGATDGFCLGQ